MPTGVYKKTEEHRKNLSEAHKGMKKPWSKNNPQIFKGGHVPWNKGKKWSSKILAKITKAIRKSMTEEAKKKMSEANLRNPRRYWLGKKRPDMTGKKHFNWNNGSSFEPYSLDWTETLRRSIRERDNYICQLCSQYGNTVHHIDYQKQNCNPDNLITLCHDCNIRVNKNRESWELYFKNILIVKNLI